MKIYNLFLKIICRIVPEQFLKKAFLSINNALVVSNIPGIKDVSVFNGLYVEDIIFWIPNKSKTGLII